MSTAVNKPDGFDVIVIGGGPAGSLSSFLVGRRGHSVCLLDAPQTETPRACGEGLSFIGRRYLERAGLWSSSLAKAATPFYGFEIVSPRYRSVLSGKRPMGHGVRRAVLDRSLRDAAAKLPLVSIRTERAIALERAGERWEVRTASGVIRSSRIVLASGTAGRSLLPRGATTRAPRRGARYGLTLRIKDCERVKSIDRVVISVDERVQILLTPLADGRANITAFTRRADARDGRERRSKDDLVDRIRVFAEHLGLGDYTVESCSGAASIDSSSVMTEPGIYLVGDAAEQFDPIGGMGMSHALLSASLAAKAIARDIERPGRPKVHWRRYQLRRRLYSLPLKLATNASYALNVDRNRLLGRLTSTLPAVALSALRLVEQLTPVGGLVLLMCGVLPIAAAPGIVSAETSSQWFLPQTLSDENATVTFEVDTTWHKVHGTESGLEGEIAMTNGAGSQPISAHVTLPAANLRTGDDDRDEKLHEIIAADRFPHITFDSSFMLTCSPEMIAQNGPCSDVVSGIVRIRDIERPISIPILISADRAGFLITGSQKLRWKDFGVEDPSIFLFAKVNPVVEITFRVHLNAATSARSGGGR